MNRSGDKKSIDEKIHEFINKLPWMLREPKLIVATDSDVTCEFITIDNNSPVGIGLYKSPATFDGDNHLVDEYIFLPITVGEFSNHRRTYIGYLIAFHIVDMTRVQLLDNEDNAVYDADYHLTIHRIFYRTRNKAKIIVDRFGDQMIPSMQYRVCAPKTSFSDKVDELYREKLYEICHHFAVFNDI